MTWNRCKSSSNEAMTKALNYVLCIISEIKRQQKGRAMPGKD